MFGKLKKAISKVSEGNGFNLSDFSLSDLNIDVEGSKGKLINKIATVDYDTLPGYLDKVPDSFHEQKEAAHGLLGVMKTASELYKTSDEDKRDGLFISHLTNNIDLENTLKIIDPIWKYIPYGKMMKMGLGYVVKKSKKK